MTKKRLIKIALLLIASAALLFLAWLEDGMSVYADRAYVNRIARRYMLSDLSPVGGGKNTDYVFDAGEHLVFISNNGSFVKARDKQAGCALQPSTSQSWKKDMDMSVPFYFTAYCDNSSAVSAELELRLRQSSPDGTREMWERSYFSKASVKKGLASLAVKTESDEVSDDKNHAWGLLGFSTMESYMEYNAFAKLQAWSHTGEAQGLSATATLRFYDSGGGLISETTLIIRADYI